MDTKELFNMQYSELCRQLGDAHIRHKLFGDRIAELEREISRMDKALEIVKIGETMKANQQPASESKPTLAAVPDAANETDATAIESSQPG